MKRLAEYIEKKERLQRRIRGAMVYPIGIFIIAIIIVIVLLWKVIPTFETMFSQRHFGNLVLKPRAPEQMERLKECKGVAGFHIMAIEWEERVHEIVEGAGLYPRPQV
mgnify:CR=1 FL=1